MMKCPYCESTEWTQAKTDLGMPHFKAEGVKPIRMSLHRCNGCGHVALFAKKDGEK